MKLSLKISAAVFLVGAWLLTVAGQVVFSAVLLAAFLAVFCFYFSALCSGVGASDFRYLFSKLVDSKKSKKPLKEYIELLRENDSLAEELCQSRLIHSEAIEFADQLLSDWKRHEQASAVLDSIKFAPDVCGISNN